MSIPVTVTPVLTFTAPSSGSLYTFNGYGFPANEASNAITIAVGNNTVVTTGNTGGTGTFSVGGSVAGISNGTYSVTASDSSGTLATATSQLTIGTGSGTGVTLTSYSGPVGTSVTATDTNLSSYVGQTLYVYFGSNYVGSATVVSPGTASATFNVPSVAYNSSYSVQFELSTSPYTVLGSATFTVSTSGTGTLTLSPSSGPVGTFVTVYGYNFAANQTNVQLTVNGVNYGTWTATYNGTVTATFTVPSASYGTYIPVTLGGQSGSFYVTSTTSGTNTITLSPTSGSVGTTVTAYGSVSIPNATVLVQMLYNGSYITLASTTSSASYTFSTSFTIPNVTSGTYPIYLSVNGALTGTVSSLTVGSAGSGNLTLSPSSGPVGTSVTVTGYGFPAYTTVTITYAGTYVASTTTTASGTYTATFSVPSTYTSGTQTVTATSSTYGYTSYAYFTVGATSTGLISLTLTPSIASAGAMVTASGYGSGPYLPIVITYGGTQVANTTTTSSNYYSVTFTVPATPTGAVTVVADETTYGYTASATLNGSTSSSITLSLSPTSGAAGSSVTASGTVLGAYQTVNISIGGNQVATTTGTSAGTYSVSFTIPSGTASGPVTVTATQVSYNSTATATFTVPAAPQISLSSSTATPGTSVTVTGSGFYANESVTITLPGGTTTTATATSSGSISTQVTIPTGTAAGTATISAIGATSQVKATATITIISPSLTAPLAFVNPGGIVNLTGTGFAPGEAVTVSASAGGSQTVTATSSGGFSLTVAIGANQQSGTITYTAQGVTSQATATATITVIALHTSTTPTPTPSKPTPTPSPTTTPPPTTTPTPVPATGGSTTWIIPSGRTNGGYGEQINITNPNNQPVTGVFTFYYNNGKGQPLTKLYPFTVKADASGYFNISRIAPALPGVSAMVVANLRVQVSPLVKFKNGPWSVLSAYGRERTFWSLSGGALPESLDLLNSGNTAAHILVTWGQGRGNRLIQDKVTLAPHSRISIEEATHLQQPAQGTSVKSDVAIGVAHTTAVG
jgi:hypothetical protein